MNTNSNFALDRTITTRKMVKENGIYVLKSIELRTVEEARVSQLGIKEAIGYTLRKLRKERGLTLREVSKASSVSLGFVSEVERGAKEASDPILESLAKALNVKIYDVLIEAAMLIRMTDPDAIPDRIPEDLLAPTEVR